MKPEKILFMMLPFWTPLIPPMGICSLKSFLMEHGYTVKTYDLNIRPELWEMNKVYFTTLKRVIPPEKQGNFINIGYNVLRNHLTAYINREVVGNYPEFLRELVYRYYYSEIPMTEVLKLDETIHMFYRRLETCLDGIFDTERPTVLGLSVLSGNLGPSLYTYRFAKKKTSPIRTVMGGGVFASDELVVGSPDLEYFQTHTPEIDQIMIGPGYDFWLKYLKNDLPAGKKMFIQSDFSPDTEQERQPLPDYADLDLRYYPYLGATGSTSCPNQCSFCNVSLFWGEYRKKSPARTVDQMEELHRRYHYQLFFMTDSLLNPVIQDLSQEMIQRGFSLYWDGYLRVDEAAGDVNNTFLWRRGGFYRARLGIESGAQRVLDIMGKKITVNQIKAALSALAAAGIKTTAYFVIGHPGESEEEFQQTLDLVTEMKDDIWEAECNPFGYSYTGQKNSNEWADQRISVFPEAARALLLARTWDLEIYPSREEKYLRVFRFTEHCQNLGIPNPYSLQELYTADERWKMLHKNAVPGLVEFQRKDGFVTENKIFSRSIPVSPANPLADEKESEFMF